MSAEEAQERRFALLSVHDKTGLPELTRALVAAGFSLLSTGGTAAVLREGGFEVLDVGAYTGFPEMMDGRVKTLHPKVHGGLLGRTDLESHLSAMREHGISRIDLVAVNLYPFEATIAREGVSREEAIEQIDIGGPSMIRSAAKNHERVTVLVDPEDYPEVIEALGKEGAVPESLRRRCALKAFARTAAYDARIATWLAGGEGEAPPAFFAVTGFRKNGLRYGENPHQRAAFFLRDGEEGGLAEARFLGGKELSYNNLLDLDAAWRLIAEFPREEGSACAVLKHNNPCGAALAESPAEAWEKALAGDPLSAFGSIVAFNSEVDRATAEAVAAPGNFVEAIIAPGFREDAVEVLRGARFGKNLRLLAAGEPSLSPAWDLRSLAGGVLVQDRDVPLGVPEMECVTKRAPTEEERAELSFAWRIAKHVKSNAIVLTKGRAVVGVGAGQMSRVDSVEIAARKAGTRAEGAVLASDAFFPFPDGVEKAAEAGVSAVIQPGGSRRDGEVIAASDRLGLAMVFTGVRHFRH